jgi:hypothetical protein
MSVEGVRLRITCDSADERRHSLARCSEDVREHFVKNDLVLPPRRRGAIPF